MKVLMVLYGLLLYILTTPIAFGACHSTVKVTVSTSVNLLHRTNAFRERYCERDGHNAFLNPSGKKLHSRVDILYHSPTDTLTIGAWRAQYPSERTGLIFGESRPDINLPVFFVRYRF